MRILSVLAMVAGFGMVTSPFWLPQVDPGMRGSGAAQARMPGGKVVAQAPSPIEAVLQLVWAFFGGTGMPSATPPGRLPRAALAPVAHDVSILCRAVTAGTLGHTSGAACMAQVMPEHRRFPRQNADAAPLRFETAADGNRGPVIGQPDAKRVQVAP
ncbi:MAG: hypothetical protein KF887_15610 [Paracoccaceae bacterium]|nr:MAG: hypothetical protein KF887_15610 [Paracoccaceae bacterium]